MEADTEQDTAMATKDSQSDQIEILMKKLKEKDAKITQLEEHVLSLETEPLQNKKRRLSNGWEHQDCDSKDEEIARLMNENEQLKRKIENWSDLEATDCLGIPGDHHQNKAPTQKSDADTSKIIKIIEDKLNKGFETIQSNVEKLINEKVTCLKNPTMQNAKQTTYASVMGSTNTNGNVTELKTIMMANKNEEITEKAEKKRRATNLIVHGRQEPLNKRDEEDKIFTEALIKDLQVGAIHAKAVERIGDHSIEKTRPIKLVFHTEEDQQKVLSNLKNLKGNTKYKGISIKEDYTIGERQLIKEFVAQAKAQTEREETKGSDIIWRVRGTPKNGLVLKKFTKTREKSQNEGLAPQQE